MNDVTPIASFNGVQPTFTRRGPTDCATHAKEAASSSGAASCNVTVRFCGFTGFAVTVTARLSEGRAAWSEYRVRQRFQDFTLLEVRIGTGRTHQIRVHLASIKHPVVGDTLYGASAQPLLGRFFLHAHRIRFRLPSGPEIAIESPLAPELEAWLKTL